MKLCTSILFFCCVWLALLFLPSSQSFPLVVSQPKPTARQSPHSSHHTSTTRSSRNLSENGASSTRLFHNQKKKRNNNNSSGAGFASPFRNSLEQVFPYTGTVRPGQQSPQRVVLQEDIVKPDYWQTGRPSAANAASRQLRLPWMIEVKTATEIERMREAGRLARHVLDFAGRLVESGITTDEIDAAVHHEIVQVRKQQCKRWLRLVNR